MLWECKNSSEPTAWDVVVKGKKQGVMGSHSRSSDSRASKSDLHGAGERSQPGNSLRSQHASWEAAVQPRGDKRVL